MSNAQIITVIISTVISWAVTFFLGGVAAYLQRKYNKLIKRNEELANRQQAVENGLQSLLRNEIIEYHDKYTDRGFCPIYAKEAARRCYEAYHALGGNGVITKLYNDIMALPEEPPKPKKQNGGKNSCGKTSSSQS